MRARTIWFSRSAVAAAAALSLAACGESPAPPVKTADDAPGASTTTAPPPAEAPSSAPTAAATAAPTTVMVGAPATTAAPVVDGHVFKKKLPAIGAKVIESETKTTNLTLDVTVKPKAKPVQAVRSDRSTIEKTVEVLAVSADAITKVKVTYKTHSKVEKKDAKESATTSPVAGKTYVVEAKDGAITVLTDKGAAAPADETKAVQDDFKKLGKPNDLAKAIPDTPIKIGDRVDAIGQALQARVTKDDDAGTKTTVESTAVTLTKVNDKGGAKTGVFDLAFNLTVEKDSLIIRMKVKGTVEVRMEDGFPVSMSLQAPTTLATPDGAPGPKISGSGVSTMEGTRQVL